MIWSFLVFIGIILLVSILVHSFMSFVSFPPSLSPGCLDTVSLCIWPRLVSDSLQSSSHSSQVLVLSLFLFNMFSVSCCFLTICDMVMKTFGVYVYWLHHLYHCGIGLTDCFFLLILICIFLPGCLWLGFNIELFCSVLGIFACM